MPSRLVWCRCSRQFHRRRPPTLHGVADGDHRRRRRSIQPPWCGRRPRPYSSLQDAMPGRPSASADIVSVGFGWDYGRAEQIAWRTLRKSPCGSERTPASCGSTEVAASESTSRSKPASSLLVVALEALASTAGTHAAEVRTPWNAPAMAPPYRSTSLVRRDKHRTCLRRSSRNHLR